ncbi:unnamed protein product, partial [Discosporangium mesarthrocarpum]
MASDRINEGGIEAEEITSAADDKEEEEFLNYFFSQDAQDALLPMDGHSQTESAVQRQLGLFGDSSGFDRSRDPGDSSFDYLQQGDPAGPLFERGGSPPGAPVGALESPPHLNTPPLSNTTGLLGGATSVSEDASIATTGGWGTGELEPEGVPEELTGVLGGGQGTFAVTGNAPSSAPLPCKGEPPSPSPARVPPSTPMTSMGVGVAGRQGVTGGIGMDLELPAEGPGPGRRGLLDLRQEVGQRAPMGAQGKDRLLQGQGQVQEHRGPHLPTQERLGAHISPTQSGWWQ